MYIEMSECGHFCTLYSVHMTAYCHHLMSLALSLSLFLRVCDTKSACIHFNGNALSRRKWNVREVQLLTLCFKFDSRENGSFSQMFIGPPNYAMCHTHTHFSKHCACFSLRRNQIWMVHTKCGNQDFLATFEVVWVFVSRCSGSNQIEIGWRNCPESARHRLGHFGFKEGSRPKIRMGSFSKKNHANWKNLVSEKVEDLFPNIHKNCGSESSGPPRWKNI